MVSAETGRGKRRVEKLLQVNPLSWASLGLPGNCLKSLKNAAAALRNEAAPLKCSCAAQSGNLSFKQRLRE